MEVGEGKGLDIEEMENSTVKVTMAPLRHWRAKRQVSLLSLFSYKIYHLGTSCLNPAGRHGL